MAQLAADFIGPPRLRHGDHEVALPTRKVLALLAYLAVEGGGRSRETLASLLWPEGGEARARGSLRRALASLRAALGDDHLIAERDQLSCSRSDASAPLLDVRLLDTALAVARRVAAEGGAEPLLRALREAVSTMRGEFLEGLSLPDAPDFESWLEDNRRQIRSRQGEVCDRLTALLIARGEAAEAATVAERWLGIEPLAEDAYQRLMEAQAGSGSIPAALQTFQRCRETLRRETGSEPAPETAALADRLRALLPGTGAAPRPLGVAGMVEAPMVGRADEFALLVSLFQRAAQGAPQIALIEGEAGIGKTRLAQEFSDRLAARGTGALRGQAFEAGGRLPYQPVVDALRNRLEQENAPDDLLADIWLTELSRLLPELRERYPDLPPPAAVDEEAARTRLFEAVARMIQSLAARSPQVLLIEDVQWADAASRDLLLYLARRFGTASTPALLLLSGRDEELRGETNGAAWLNALTRELPLTRATLHPLPLDALHRLLLGLAEDGTEAAAPQLLAAALQAETGGQPLFVMETLKTLVERGTLRVGARSGRLDLAPDAAAACAAALPGLLPPGVRNVVRGRLNRLAPQAFAVLVAAAVLGRGASFERLCEVAELSENDALPALDALLSANLLHEASGSEQSYLFSHDRIRDVVYAEAGEARRRLYHRRSLTALEAAGAPAAELAEHALGARLAGRAVRHALAAGDDAMRLFAVRDAAGYYERARLALVSGPVGEAAHELNWQEREHLYLQLARTHELLGDLARARELYEELLAAAQSAHASQPADAAKAECAALSKLAMLEVQQWIDLDRPAVLLQQALRAAEASGDALARAETEWHLAQLHFYRWEAEASLAHGRQALALARPLGNQDLIARSLNVIAYILINFPGDWAEGERCAIEASEILQSLHSFALQADCMLLATQARIHLSRVREAIDLGSRALAITRSIENIWGQCNASFRLSLALLEAGRYGEALALAREGCSLAQGEVAWSPLVVLNLVTLGEVQRALFDLPAALQAHTAAIEEGERNGWNHFEELTAAEVALDYARLGQYAKAEGFVRRAQARRDRTPYWVIVRTCVEEIETLLARGDAAAAEQTLARYLQDSGGAPRYRIEYLRGRAAIERARGESAAAASSLREALALAEALELPGPRLAVATALALRLEELADPEAEGVRRQAAAAAQQLASSIDDPAERERFCRAGGVL